MTTKTATKETTALTTTAPAGAITAINPDFLQPLALPRSGYPALQASKYRNLSEESVIKLGLSSGAADLLGADALDSLSPEIISVKYEQEEEAFFVPDPSVRWIPLAFPKKYIQDNSGDRPVYRLSGGEWNDKCKSVCRLFLAAIRGDELIYNAGEVAIFGLTFKGMRTQRITGKEGSLLSLNSALCKHYGINIPAYMGHLASIEISCKAAEFASAADSKLSSMSVDFILSGARLLPPNIQAVTAALVKEDHHLMAAIADPFNIAGTAPAAATIMEDGDFLF
jgi:hypothetical protein